MKKQILVSILIFLFLILGTAAVIIYGKGYGISFQNGRPELSGTGLLVATSSPDGAEVLIDGHLTTATNNTIDLLPGNYKVEIFKDGYFPWSKNIIIKKEVVNKATALLLPTAPQLQSLTDLGANNPIMDPSLTRIAYTVSSQSAQKNGIYVFNMNSSSLIPLSGSETQIVDDNSGDTFSNSQISWSPDGTQLLATVSSSLKTTTYLLQANGFNSNPQDVTETLANVENTWNTQALEKANSQINGLKSKLKNIVKNNFNILSWSPDQTKILYIASQSATIPQIITPPLIGVDSTSENRNIEMGKIYIYDLKEDRNYPIQYSIPSEDLNNNTSDNPSPTTNSPIPYNLQTTAKPLPIHWLNDSAHLVLMENRKIEIEEYDGANKTTVYAGPFVDSFVYPWPDGSKIVMLTNLGNDQITPNLYTISLK